MPNRIEVYKTKKALNFFSAFAPAGIGLLNLWNDFRKVVQNAGKTLVFSKRGG